MTKPNVIIVTSVDCENHNRKCIIYGGMNPYEKGFPPFEKDCKCYAIINTQKMPKFGDNNA